MRSRELAVVFVAALALTAGCLAVQDRYEATPATVGDDALADTGYEETRADRLTRTLTDVRGTEDNVTVVSHARSYARTVEIGGEPRPLAAAGVVSTPSIEVANRQFNPVADWSARELLDRFRDRVGDEYEGGLRDVSREGTREATVLGTETDLTTFRATTTVAGTEVPLTVEVGRVSHRGDFVVVVAAYPADLDERPAVDRLLGGLEHAGSDAGDTDGTDEAALGPQPAG